MSLSLTHQTKTAPGVVLPAVRLQKEAIFFTHRGILYTAALYHTTPDSAEKPFSNLLHFQSGHGS